MGNYPDGMNESNNDPRSPNYDDQGEEIWCEKRFIEIKSNLNLLDLDFDNIDEILSQLISDQVDREWSEMKIIETLKCMLYALVIVILADGWMNGFMSLLYAG